MARLFNGTNQFVARDAPTVTGPPVTYSCWARLTAVPAAAPQAISGSNTGSTHELGLIIGSGATQFLQAYAYDGTVFSGPSSVAGLVVGQWEHCAGVFVAPNLVSTYLNNVRTDGTATFSAISLNQFSIGARRVTSTISGYWPGDIAEAAAWNVALMDAEIAALSKRVSPLLIRPNALVAYWPFLNSATPDQDRWRNGYHLTPVNAPTMSPHLAVYMPSLSSLGAASAQQLGSPWHHYAQMRLA